MAGTQGSFEGLPAVEPRAIGVPLPTDEEATELEPRHTELQHRTLEEPYAAGLQARAEQHPQPQPDLQGPVPPRTFLQRAASVLSTPRPERRWSTWRWPASPGEMPAYVQRQFRLKTFGLLGLQLAVVFAIMVLVEVMSSWGVEMEQQRGSQLLFYTLGAVSLALIIALYCVSGKYPFNYITLAAVTVVTGFFWGLTRVVLTTLLHFQVIGILCVTMFTAALVSAFLSYQKAEPTQIILGSLGLGWLVGSMIDLVVAPAFAGIAPAFTLSRAWGFAASGLAFALLVCLLLDSGKFLAKCNPDDFMRVVVAMNSFLLVIVSIPFFVLTFCFLQTGDAAQRDAAGQQRAPAAVRDEAEQHQVV